VSGQRDRDADEMVFIDLLILLAVSLNAAYESPRQAYGTGDANSANAVSMHSQILAPLMNGAPKSLFKAWHFIFNKNYDYNTESGINKYKIFNANLKQIKEHNASGSSWKMGLNQHTDKTDAQVKAYYKLESISEADMKMPFLEGIDADDLATSGPRFPEVPRAVVDHRQHMMAVRDQGDCAAWHSFATMSVLEGCRNMWHSERLTDHLSVQMLLDCRPAAGNCDGGQAPGSFNWYKTTTMVYESTYPYTANVGKCDWNAKREGDANLRISGFMGYQYKRHSPNAYQFNYMMARGPTAVMVDANENWYKYETGIFDEKCSEEVNQEVALVGYGLDASTGVNYYVVRNSWGSSWGEEGHMRIKDNGDDVSSCNVEKRSWMPKVYQAPK
jgi:KDEL-tailed cysteine endopeptidase